MTFEQPAASPSRGVELVVDIYLAAADAGAAFGLRAFHRRALDLGSIGPTPFLAAMARS